MKKNYYKKFKKLNLEQKFSVIAGILTVVFFSILAFSSIFLQKTLKEESQDIRKEASIPTGIVQIISQETQKNWPAQSPMDIILEISTGNTLINEIQLEFDINGNISQPELNIASAADMLEITTREITPTDSGYHVKTIINLKSGETIYLSDFEEFLHIILTPQSGGAITVNFDPTSSFATDLADEDVLQTIQAMSFNVDEAGAQIDICSTPTGVKIASLSCGDSIYFDHLRLTAVMQWDPVAGANEYEVQLSRTAGDYVDNHGVTKNTSYNFVEIADEFWYARVRVKSGDTCVAGDDAWQEIYFDGDCSAQEEECQYGFGDWSSCSEGWQTRDYTVTPNSCEPPDASTLTQACANQCEYNYTDWGNCENGWQTREFSIEPQNCHWYETRHLEELSQECEEDKNSDGDSEDSGDDSEVTEVGSPHLYNYESCWYGNSGGETTSIYWDDALFPDVTWVDISPYADFHEFANKNVENSTVDYYQYLLTNGSGFKWNTSGNPNFHFTPGTTYYVRLFNGTHSPVETYYIPLCSGVGSVSYQQCNEGCSNNNECAPNLTCYQNQCRLVTNVESDLCVLPPDAGLNRTCNEYCADNNECSSGFTCSWNRCRNPQNLDATDCQNPQLTTNTTYSTLASLPQIEPDVAQYCNAYCNYNRDCGPNFRCYGNQCRLATNPESTTCDSYIVEASAGEKGADDSSSYEETATTEVETDSELSPTTEETPVVSESEKTKPVEEQTALDALVNYLESKGYSLQLLGQIFLGLLVILVLVSALKKIIKKPKSPPPIPPTKLSTPPSSTPPTTLTPNKIESE